MSKGKTWNRRSEEDERGEKCVIENLLHQKVVLNYMLEGAFYCLVLRPRERVVLGKSREALEGALGQYVFSQTIRII